MLKFNLNSNNSNYMSTVLHKLGALEITKQVEVFDLLTTALERFNVFMEIVICVVLGVNSLVPSAGSDGDALAVEAVVVPAGEGAALAHRDGLNVVPVPPGSIPRPIHSCAPATGSLGNLQFPAAAVSFIIDDCAKV